MSTNSKTQIAEAESELRQSRRRFKKRRVTQQIRIDTGIHPRLRSLAREMGTTISKLASKWLFEAIKEYTRMK